MATYKIYVDYSACVEMEITADSEQKARKKAVRMCTQPEWLEKASKDLIPMKVYTEK